MVKNEHVNATPPPAGGTVANPIQGLIQQIYEKIRPVTGGEVATYIPELARANPDWFGVTIVTTSGTVYEVGDSRQPFTIQSISKPFVYGIALEDNGRDSVLQKVGVEPTGDAFNSISLEPGTGRPRNPMINAGAIATTGLIGGRRIPARLQRLMDVFSTYAGRPLQLDEAVYRSESETGHRNRAIGHMLRNFDILDTDPMPVTELYFKQCSIEVNCRDLAVMAATLANRGVNPVTGRQPLRAEYVESVLSVMETCGMYNSAGEWTYNVGMPAKSGVAGGIIAVLPGQLGIGVFSPRLDANGNSVRGVRVCQEISRRLDLHLLNRPPVGRSTIRHQFTGADFTSSRQRTPSEAGVLRTEGRQLRVWQLQGHLTFATVEVAVRDVVEALATCHWAVLDFKRVLSLNDTAAQILHQLWLDATVAGRQVVFAATDGVPILKRLFRLKARATALPETRFFPDTDQALEWGENELLTASLPTAPVDRMVPVEELVIAAGLTVEERRTLASHLTSRRFAEGETIITAGDPPDQLFLLRRGRVSVLPGNDSVTRLATFSAGMTFGEMGLIDGAPRSARIVADTAVECDQLSAADFEALNQTHPALKIKLLRNLCIDLSLKLRKANRELAVMG